MKSILHFQKIALMLILTSFCYCQAKAQAPAPIDNGSFENWGDVFIMEVPDDWEVDKDHKTGPLTTSKVEDGSDGTYSIKLETAEDPYNPDSDPVFGSTFMGEVGSDGPSGGIPWTDDVDELIFDVKYDITGNDAAQVLIMIFDDAGDQIGGGQASFTGTENSWTGESVNITYSDTPAEIMIGFTSSDHQNPDNVEVGSWIQVDDVRLFYQGAEVTGIPNNNFENWSDFTIYDPDYWTSTNMELSENEITNVEQTTDAETGDYAAKLTNILMGEGTSWEYVMTGYLTYGDELYGGNVAYNDKPEFLIGFYNYSPEGSDMGKIYCHFDDDTDPDNGMLGNASFEFGGTNEYERFVLPINYWESTSTNYTSLNISAGTEGVDGSELFVDNLQYVNGYDVTFNVSDDHNPIQDALIEIDTYKNSEDLMTNADGIKTLGLPDGTYDFTVSHADYDDYIGSFSVNESSQNVDVEMSMATGISEIDKETLSIYPVPVDDQLHFTRSLFIEDYRITNLKGSLVKQESINGNVLSIKVGDVSPGYYILSINSPEGKLKHKILIAR